MLNEKQFRTYQGMETLVERPTFTKVTSSSIPSIGISNQSSIKSISTQNTQQNKLQSFREINEMKSIPQQNKLKSNEIPSINSIYSTPNQPTKTTLPSLNTEMNSTKQQLRPIDSLNVNGSNQSTNLPQFTTLNTFNTFKPLQCSSPQLQPIESLLKTSSLNTLNSINSIQRKSNEIIQTITNKTINSIYMIGYLTNSSNIQTMKLITQDIFGDIISYPLKLSNENEIKKYSNDIIQLIEKSFTHNHSQLLINLFQFGFHLSQIKKYFNERNELNLQLVTNDIKKYYSKIEFCLSLEFKSFLNDLFTPLNDSNYQFNFDEKYNEIKELFILN